MDSLTIGQMAKQAQVNIETIRYYERRGLLPEPPRTASGYRQYSEEAVVRVRFIKHAQQLGFSLREVLELLALRVDADTTCADVREFALAKMAEIERKLQMLEQMKQALDRLAAMCQQEQAPTSACPILDALEQSSAPE